MSSGSVTNGDSPHSVFLSHLTSIPVVHDGITTYKSNPYGAKTISIANQAFSVFIGRIYKPLSPYLAGPYSYVAPYVAKADSLGDNGLKTLESKFPIVKEDTASIQKTVNGYAAYPREWTNHGKDVVLGTWEERYQYHQGKNHVIRLGLTALDTQLRIVGLTYQAIADRLAKTGSELDKKAAAKKNENSG